MVVADLGEFSSSELLRIFTLSTIFHPPQTSLYDVVLIGGGGGGGSASSLHGDIYFGSGGGAGGFQIHKGVELKEVDRYVVLVGVGGIGGTVNQKGTPGGSTRFGKFVALGGGGGGAGTTFGDRHLGMGGGSGGGSSIFGRQGPGAGKMGNNGGSSTNHGGAGGGGLASEPLANDDPEYVGQIGGAGVLIELISENIICQGGHGGGQLAYSAKDSRGLGGDMTGYLSIHGRHALFSSGSGGGGGSAKLESGILGRGGSGGSGLCAIFKSR